MLLTVKINNQYEKLPETALFRAKGTHCVYKLWEENGMYLYTKNMQGRGCVFVKEKESNVV